MSKESVVNSIRRKRISMRALITRSLALLFALALMASVVANNFNYTRSLAATDKVSALAVSVDPNPLLANWEGPYGGVPPFDRVKIEYL